MSTIRRYRMRLVLAVMFLPLVWLLPLKSTYAAEKITVFSAGGMGNLVQELIAIYPAAQSGAIEFRTNFAASSALARQIDQGADADIYISANRLWFDFLDAKKLIEPDSGSVMATNALVLIADPKKTTTMTRIEQLPEALGAKSYLAMGEISHVPAGMYSKEALEYYGIWSKTQQHVAQYPTVRSVLNAVSTGQAEFGIVFRSELKIDPTVQWVLTLDESSHTPVEFMIGVVRGRNTPAVGAFLDFLKTALAKEKICQFGFVPQ